MKSFLLMIFIFLSAKLLAQSNDFAVFCDKDWKPVSEKKAKNFLFVHQINDSAFQWIYYKMYGPRFKKETYRDSAGKIRNGDFAWYNSAGFIDSSGKFYDNKRSGDWYLGGNGSKSRVVTYLNGEIIKEKPGEIKKTVDLTLKPDEKESEYEGGMVGWGSYLRANMKYPDRAIDAEVSGEVRVQFIVDKDGSVVNPEIAKSVEFSLDEESLRLINNSAKWVPATQQGKIVKSYKIQPFKFSLTAK